PLPARAGRDGGPGKARLVDARMDGAAPAAAGDRARGEARARAGLGAGSAATRAQERHRGIVPGDRADAAAPPRTGATQQHPRVGGLRAPGSDLVLVLGERPLEVAVEDVP